MKSKYKFFGGKRPIGELFDVRVANAADKPEVIPDGRMRFRMARIRRSMIQ